MNGVEAQRICSICGWYVVGAAEQSRCAMCGLTPDEASTLSRWDLDDCLYRRDMGLTDTCCADLARTCGRSGEELETLLERLAGVFPVASFTHERIFQPGRPLEIIVGVEGMVPGLRDPRVFIEGDIEEGRLERPVPDRGTNLSVWITPTNDRVGHLHIGVQGWTPRRDARIYCEAFQIPVITDEQAETVVELDLERFTGETTVDLSTLRGRAEIRMEKTKLPYDGARFKLPKGGGHVKIHASHVIGCMAIEEADGPPPEKPLRTVFRSLRRGSLEHEIEERLASDRRRMHAGEVQRRQAEIEECLRLADVAGARAIIERLGGGRHVERYSRAATHIEAVWAELEGGRTVGDAEIGELCSVVSDGEFIERRLPELARKRSLVPKALWTDSVGVDWAVVATDRITVGRRVSSDLLVYDAPKKPLTGRDNGEVVFDEVHFRIRRVLGEGGRRHRIAVGSDETSLVHLDDDEFAVLTDGTLVDFEGRCRLLVTAGACEGNPYALLRISYIVPFGAAPGQGPDEIRAGMGYALVRRGLWLDGAGRPCSVQPSGARATLSYHDGFFWLHAHGGHWAVDSRSVRGEHFLGRAVEVVTPDGRPARFRQGTSDKGIWEQ